MSLLENEANLTLSVVLRESASNTYKYQFAIPLSNSSIKKADSDDELKTSLYLPSQEKKIVISQNMGDGVSSSYHGLFHRLEEKPGVRG